MLKILQARLQQYMNWEIPDTQAEFRHLKQKLHSTHEKMGTIKERNGMDLTEAEDIKKRWQEYTEELYKKELHDPITMVWSLT